MTTPTAAKAFKQFLHALQTEQLVDVTALHTIATKLTDIVEGSSDLDLTRTPMRLAAKALFAAGEMAGVERTRFDERRPARERLRMSISQTLKRLTTITDQHILMAKSDNQWTAIAICPETPLVSHATAVARLEKHLSAATVSDDGESKQIRRRDGSVITATQTRIVDIDTASELMWRRAEHEDALACIDRLRRSLEDLRFQSFASEIWERGDMPQEREISQPNVC